jgi:hypothetical protein
VGGGREAHNDWVTVRALLGGLLLSALGAIGPAAVWAQSVTEMPLNGVIVTVERVDDKTLVAKSITGSDGVVRLNVPAGLYRIMLANAPAALRVDAAKRAGISALANANTGGLATPDRTLAITIMATTYGSVRERSILNAEVTDALETVTIETMVSSPIRIVVQRREQ